ncbi:MAG: hypothetical protein ACYCST_04410 [Acidimicrobiales bacterium]
MEKLADASPLKDPYSRVLSTMSEEVERLTFERDAISAAIESLEKAARSLGSVSLAPPSIPTTPPPPAIEQPAVKLPDPFRSHHKSPAAKAQPARAQPAHGAPLPPGAIGARLKSLLDADPQRSWTAVDLVQTLKSEGLVTAVDPEAAMRTLLTRLIRKGRIERRERGHYGAISSR